MQLWEVVGEARDVRARPNFMVPFYGSMFVLHASIMQPNKSPCHSQVKQEAKGDSAPLRMMHLQPSPFRKRIPPMFSLSDTP